MSHSLPARIQERLSSYYGIDHGPSVDEFVRPSDDSREELVIRDCDDGLELSLCLPRAAVQAGHEASFDEVCQAIEGVSHFLYLVERVRCELPVTQLELELQAEVDKYVLFLHGFGPRPGASAAASSFEPRRASWIRARLFEQVTFLHPAGTERGDRYRMANDLAARFAGRLESSYARRGRFGEMRAALRRFYRVGQTEKIALARAA